MSDVADRPQAGAWMNKKRYQIPAELARADGCRMLDNSRTAERLLRRRPGVQQLYPQLSAFDPQPFMHLCLLDIDGTLILTGGAGQKAFAQTLAEDFDIPQLNTQVAFAGRSDRAIVADLFRGHGVEPTDANWERFRSGYLARLDAALAGNTGAVLPGVLPFLEALAERGDIALGLVTGNIREGARRKLTRYDLWDWFPFGGFGDAHTERCDIAAAALAAGRLHLQDLATSTDGNGAAISNTDHLHALREVVVIGDTLHDISCGRSIGARCVAVATGHSPTSELMTGEPDVLLETLEDPSRIFEFFN